MGRASSAKQLSEAASAERLQDNESFCIGDEAMQLDMVKRPDEEEEDLESAQVDEWSCLYHTVLYRYGRYCVPSVGVLIIYSEGLKLIKQLYQINLRPRGLVGI